MGLTAGGETIDLCSGDGWFTYQISKVSKRVFAIDIDAKLLELARHRLSENGVTNCEFIEGDAYEVAKLVPRPVDFVFLANAFHGVPDRPRLAHSVSAALKANGLFAIVNWHARPRDETKILGEPRGPKTELRMRPESVMNDVQPSGLKFLKTVEVPPYHYGAVFKKSAT